MKIAFIKYKPELEFRTDRLYKQAGHAVTSYSMLGDLPDKRDYDVLVISGAPLTPQDEQVPIRKLVDRVQDEIERNRHIFGHCYGAQIIARAAGATFDYQQELGWNHIHPTSKEGVFENVEGLVPTFHYRDWVIVSNDNLNEIAVDSNGHTQGIKVNNALGLAGHSEFTKPVMKKLLDSNKACPKVSSGVLREYDSFRHAYEQGSEIILKNVIRMQETG